MATEKKLKAIGMCVCMLVFSCRLAEASLTDAIMADNPSAYFKFEETSVTDGSTAIDTVGGTGMTYRGSNFANTEGVGGGNALLFDGSGDSFVQLLNDTRLAPSQTGTGVLAVEFWMYTTSSNITQRAVSWHGNYDAQYDVHLESTGVFSTYVVENTFADYAYMKSNYDLSEAGGQPQANLGEWYNVVLQIDLNTHTWQCLVNGVLVGEDTNANLTQMEKSAAGLIVGMRYNTTTNPFSGAIDELAVYDHFLTTENIASHMAAVPEPATLMLIAAGGYIALLKRRKKV